MMSAALDLRPAPRVNTAEPFAPLPWPGRPAHVIASDTEAIAIAERLARDFAREAALRDREGLVPVAEVEAFSQSGLWAIRVPKRFGGAELSYVTVTEVLKVISAADPSLGQLPQNHLSVVDHIALGGSEAQQRELFEAVLRGVRFGSATSEAGGKHVGALQTHFVEDGDDVILNGEKFYATGALVAHIVPVAAVDGDGRVSIVFADRGAPGLEVVNDWSAFGQRTTASGTVKLTDVRVPKHRVVPAHQAFDRPTASGPISQIMQAAIDAGIAKGTLADTLAFVRGKARPWLDSGQDRASDDPFTIAAIGELEIKLHAAEAVLERAAQLTDAAIAHATEDTVAEAAVAVAEAKVLTTEVAILAANKLFELGGTRSTLAAHDLDRHWRNARTHTLHDPVRWKFFHVGNYHLNGVRPPRHLWL
jgi:SfnB family sulfur acquisition oxidoreductase